jgi:aminoglycoside phosphotransferase (APT) family kinase protein
VSPVTPESPPAPPVPALDVDALAAWLGAHRVTVLGRPGASGYSGETWFLDADGARLVLRTAPAEPGMFAHHDLTVQTRCMQHLRAHGLPAPQIVATDTEGAVLGRAAYVTERVTGRVPLDGKPDFTRAGFLAEATPAQQRHFGDDLVDRIADLHRLPRLGGLPIGPTPRDHLRWCTSQLDDPAVAPTPQTAALLAETAAHLHADDPGPGTPALVWGDARPANTVVDDDFEVVAMLDWEMAATGPPELDIAWMNEMNRIRAGGATPPLPGMPDDAEVWRRWSARTGRVPTAPVWHQRYAAYKVAVLMELHLAERVRNGGLAPDHPVRTDNRGTRRLSALLNSEDQP